MKVFIDTSAFYALAAPQDRWHEAACAIHERLKAESARVVTTNYVLLESVSLIQKRHGVSSAERFGDSVASQVDMVWITASQHRAAWEYWKQRGMRGLSLVDCSCVVVMRELGVQQVFGFDEQFRTAGFTLLDSTPPSDRVAERRGVYRTARLHRKS